jgi:predicted acylesterase/phospholipase RssA
MSKVAVIGNTARAIGAVCASDLTLSGHEVRYAVFPEQKDQLPAVRKAGGFTVEGDAKHLISKKTGFARLARVCDTTREALKDAGAVLIEVDIHQLEEKFSAMIPEFARGAVVHVQSHGYWRASRRSCARRAAKTCS